MKLLPQKVYPTTPPAPGGEQAPGPGGSTGGGRVDRKTLMWAGAGVVALVALIASRGSSGGTDSGETVATGTGELDTQGTDLYTDLQPELENVSNSIDQLGEQFGEFTDSYHIPDQPDDQPPTPNVPGPHAGGGGGGDGINPSRPHPFVEGRKKDGKCAICGKPKGAKIHHTTTQPPATGGGSGGHGAGAGQGGHGGGGHGGGGGRKVQRTGADVPGFGGTGFPTGPEPRLPGKVAHAAPEPEHQAPKPNPAKKAATAVKAAVAKRKK